MENKINIAELLKDCPKGMELDCTLFDNVVFERVDSEFPTGPIILKRLKSNTMFHTNKYGHYYSFEDSKCIIFPKGKTTWEEFVSPCQFKDGDVVYTSLGNIAIIKEPSGKEYSTHVLMSVNTLIPGIMACASRLATEEEKQKLFKAIKDNGFKWNEETKTLEKLITPKFKVGNRIRMKNSNIISTVTKNNEDGSICVNNFSWVIKYELQDKYELVLDKFDITTLIPFESRVLVRHDKDNKWCGSFFSHIDEDFHSHCYKFVTTAGKSYPMCIPYEGNKHLLGKKNDCDEYYKTWK